MMLIVIYAYAMVTMLLVLAGIAFLVEGLRRVHHEAGAWAELRASVAFFIWSATGAYIVHSM